MSSQTRRSHTVIMATFWGRAYQVSSLVLFTCATSFNPHNKSMWLVLLLFQFTGEDMEAQEDEISCLQT